MCQDTTNSLSMPLYKFDAAEPRSGFDPVKIIQEMQWMKIMQENSKWKRPEQKVKRREQSPIVGFFGHSMFNFRSTSASMLLLDSMAAVVE